MQKIGPAWSIDTVDGENNAQTPYSIPGFNLPAGLFCFRFSRFPFPSGRFEPEPRNHFRSGRSSGWESHLYPPRDHRKLDGFGPVSFTHPAAPGNDPIIFFQGDLVSGSSMARAQKVVALIKNLIAQHPGTPMLVASTGDNEQENAPTLANYQQYFGATYGTFFTQGIFRQVRGNHDVQDAGHGAAYAAVLWRQGVYQLRL